MIRLFESEGIMDDGLREAIARAAPDAKRPLAIEMLIDVCRRMQAFVRQHEGDPGHAKDLKKFVKLGRAAGRDAAQYLRFGGELRERLLSGEPIPEEDWERMCGPPLSQP